MKNRLQQGSSMIEALISLLLLAFVTMSLSSLTVSTIKTNRDARRVTAATILTQDKLEELRATNYAALAGGTDGPLSESEAIGVTGAIYTRTWTITDDTPVTSSKTVNVTTSWTDKEGNHSVQLQTIAAE